MDMRSAAIEVGTVRKRVKATLVVAACLVGLPVVPFLPTIRLAPTSTHGIRTIEDESCDPPSGASIGCRCDGYQIGNVEIVHVQPYTDRFDGAE